MVTLAKIVRWIAGKFAAACLIVVFGIAACMVWMYVRDNAEIEEWRRDTMRAITGQRAEIQAALTDVNDQLARLSANITIERNNLRLAEKLVTDLSRNDSLWERLFGNREQQRINRQRLESVRAKRDALRAHVDELQRAFTRATWTRDGLEIALGKQDAKLRRVAAQRSRLVGYVERTWNLEVGRGVLRLPLKVWVLIVLLGYFVGPSLGKVALYFWIAPWVARAKPVRLADVLYALPVVNESKVAVELALPPGERLWVKEKFLQASDEGLRRQTRYVLDWRIPFTCLATGLIELIEMTNGGPARAGGQQVTLSNQADPHTELAVVTIPPESSLIVRPSFIAGVVMAGGERLNIRRRWQLFRLQSWVTLQFRFFEFVGPCRLIIAGSRGIRAENLAERAGMAIPARRTNQDATVGFTPNLDYRPVRAETFWSYYRGMNPLFDDLFAGRGVFLCQQVASEGEAKGARKFWATVWGGVLKVFGL